MTSRSPRLTAVAVPRHPVGLVLVLHGGRSESTAPTTPLQLAVLRLTAMAAAISVPLRRRRIATYRLRFVLRGWNGALASPVADARWALEQLRERHPGVPVVIVGHSMGGRTALRVAGEDAVSGVVALAPWTPPGEPVAQLAGRGLLIAHGDRDRITSPAESRAYAGRAEGVARKVEWISVPGDTHGMLRHARTWDRLVVEAVTDLL